MYNGILPLPPSKAADMRQLLRAAMFMLLLTYALAGDEEDAREARFPIALVIHGVYRATVGTDITLYKLAITSYLYAFFGR